MNAQAQLCPGFSDPVFSSQEVFRQLLKAMSEPVLICTVQSTESCPQTLHASTYAIALSLMDQDTRLKLAIGVDSSSVRESLRFHNSVAVVEGWDQADFVICNEPGIPDLGVLNPGSEAYPDQSCTLIIQCDSFLESIPYTATGPGIQRSREFNCSALNQQLVRQREALEQRFPLGIDLILTCGQEFFCLPRTTRLGAGQH